MTKEQILANFKDAHAKQLTRIADAQFAHMAAAANLATERKAIQTLEKQFRLDMAEATASPQLALPLDAAKGGKA